MITAVTAELSAIGYSVQVVATTDRGSARKQVADFIALGIDVVFACGGDGTIHDVLQGIVGTNAKMAFIPLGSANALCRELKIPMDPIAAARAYASTQERPVRIGECRVQEYTRYFLSLSGVGPDGALMYEMLNRSKGRLGRWAYALHATRLLLRRRFTAFSVRYFDSLTNRKEQSVAVGAMALRIANLGGVFPAIARRASLQSDKLRLILVLPPALLSLPLWLLSALLGAERWNPLVREVWTEEFECDARLGERIHVQADGEWIGELPASVRLNQSLSVTLLVPTGPVFREE